MAAIFLLKDANCKTWNRRIPCQPCSFNRFSSFSEETYDPEKLKFPLVVHTNRKDQQYLASEINGSNQIVVDAQALRGHDCQGKGVHEVNN